MMLSAWSLFALDKHQLSTYASPRRRHLTSSVSNRRGHGPLQTHIITAVLNHTTHSNLSLPNAGGPQIHSLVFCDSPRFKTSKHFA